MFYFFREVRTLQKEGKIHNKLMIRVYALFFVSLIMGAISFVNVFFREANPFIMTSLTFLGFGVGLYFFSRMMPVTWDEEKEVVSVGRTDIFGYGVLGFYIIFEIVFKIILDDVYPSSATAFALATIFGLLLGRSIGTILEIHRVYRGVHPVGLPNPLIEIPKE